MPRSITDLVDGLQRDRDEARRRRDLATEQIQRILDHATAAGRSNLTADEDRTVKDLMEQRDGAGLAVRDLQRRLDEATAVRLEELEHQERRSAVTPTQARTPAYDRVLRVGAEARTYRQDEDPSGQNFLMDVSRQFIFNDPGANERLARHMAEEQVERGQQLTRAVGTGAFAGLTVPQYLTDMYAPATAAMRPFADAGCNRHLLPESGMTINISKITTGTGAALQASENAAVQNTDADDTLLTIPVQTAAGQQTVSRQAIERGTGIEDVLMQDLFNRVATVLDGTLLNQATTGLTNVASAIAYTDASATSAELWPKIIGAANTVETVLLNRGFADTVVMHPRRWNWFTSQLSSAWPLASTGDVPMNTMAVILTNEYGPAVRGRLSSGHKVIVDGNIATNYGAGTNEDEVYVVPSTECHLWEDPNAPLFIRAEQPAAASLGVLLVAYSYFGYTFQRYGTGAMGKVGGTGLIPPTF